MIKKLHHIYLTCIEKPFPILNSILIGSAVVLFWRGMWGIIDLYLLPQNESLSYIVSTILGIFVLIIHHGISKISELE